jgi:pilus assembly protein CpaD
MAKKRTIAATVALGIALAASGPALGADRQGRNPTINSVHQPVVQRTDYVLDLSAANGVPDSELYRLADWFQALQLRYGDRVYVDAGYRDDRARQDVAGVAAEYGLLLSDGSPVTAGGTQPGIVRVVVSRSVAFVPGCPDWRESYDIGARVTTATNYGCAINSNLAAMIANPEDLVLGQTGEGGGDAATASKAIKQYRTAPPTGASGLKEVSSKGGK